MNRPTVNQTHFDTVYDRMLRAERERNVLQARVDFLEAALLEQPGVCEVCGHHINDHRDADDG